MARRAPVTCQTPPGSTWGRQCILEALPGTSRGRALHPSAVRARQPPDHVSIIMRYALRSSSNQMACSTRSPKPW
jgi:hypothetical protein